MHDRILSRGAEQRPRFFAMRRDARGPIVRSYVRTGLSREIESAIFAATHTRTNTHTHACHYPERLPLHYSITICTLLGEKFLQTTRRALLRAKRREREEEREGQRGAGAITGERKGEKGTTERQEWPHDAEHRDC